MKRYKVIFKDIFDFSHSERHVNLTGEQYRKVLQQIENKEIVVNKYDKKSGIHYQLIIHSIEEITLLSGTPLKK